GCDGAGKIDWRCVPGSRNLGSELLPLAQRVRRSRSRAGTQAEGSRERERAAEAAGGRSVDREAGAERHCRGKLVSPERRRQAVDGAITSYHLSERRACRIVGQPRGTQRYSVIVRADEDALTQAIIRLAAQYGRYGYRRITALLIEAGWQVGTDRVQRIWRREGLKVPKKQKPRGRLWLNDGSC